MLSVAQQLAPSPETAPQSQKPERSNSNGSTERSARAPGHPLLALPPADPISRELLKLQRSHGNRYVARLVREHARYARPLRNAKSPIQAAPAPIAHPAVRPRTPGIIGRQPVQQGTRQRPPMIFGSDTEIVYQPDKIFFPRTTAFDKTWPILKPTFKPLAGGTFIVDGIPITYSLQGEAAAISKANLALGPGLLHELRVFVKGDEAERMRRPNTIIIPSFPPIVLTTPPDRNPHGTFSGDTYLKFQADGQAAAAAYARLDAGLGVFGNLFNAGAFAGLEGGVVAGFHTNVDTFVELTWSDGAVTLSAIMDIQTAVALALKLTAFGGVWVELRAPEIPVVTKLSSAVQDWPIVGWIVPDLEKWKWRREYKKDWPILDKTYAWNLTQRFAISSGGQTAAFPDSMGFDMEKVIRDAEGQQKAGDLKDDPGGPGKEKRNSDMAAVSSARAAALAQIASAARAAERETRANARLLATAKKAAASAKQAGPSRAGAPPAAIGSGPADPVSQLEERGKKLDQASKSTEQLRERANALNGPASAPDGVSRNEARAGFEALEKNADALGEKINRDEDVFAVPKAAEPSDAAYATMEAARRRAYDAFDECFDPTRTEKLWADDQVRSAGSDMDLHIYRDTVVRHQGNALKLWNRVQKLEADLEKAREWYESHDHGLGARVFDELRAQAVAIKGEAEKLNGARPQGDWDTDFVELSEGHLMLKPQYRGKATRSYFYPHDYSAATINRMWLKIGGVTTGADGKQYWEYRGARSPRHDFLWLVNDPQEQPTLDHTQPTVLSHWNTSGNRTDYPPRRSFYDFQGADVVVLPKKLNSSAGGREPDSYTPRVAKSFRGDKT